jgi:hypothetical protein
MAKNLYEIEDLVNLVKNLNVRISLAITHEYSNVTMSAPTSKEIVKVAGKLVEMKK